MLEEIYCKCGNVFMVMLNVFVHCPECDIIIYKKQENGKELCVDFEGNILLCKNV
jgi:hypothetical protein